MKSQRTQSLEQGIKSFILKKVNNGRYHKEAGEIEGVMQVLRIMLVFHAGKALFQRVNYFKCNSEHGRTSWVIWYIIVAVDHPKVKKIEYDITVSVEHGSFIWKH